MGHVDERDPDLALDPLQLDLQALAQLQVERAERLVEQQHRGPVDERAGERDALLLAARELAPACASPRAARPTRSSSSARARRTSSFGDLLRRSPKATFSSTLRCGKSA